MSELVAQRRVAELGIDILVTQGPAAPFDFVGHLNGCFSRIQVKTARPDKDGLRFASSTGMHASRRALTQRDCDVILAVAHDGECYIVTPNGKEQRVLTRPQMAAAILKDVTQLFVVQGRTPTKKVSGVYWSKKINRWVVSVRVNGKTYYDGSYSSYDDAILSAENIRAKAAKTATEDIPQLLRDAELPDSPTHCPTLGFEKLQLFQ